MTTPTESKKLQTVLIAGRLSVGNPAELAHDARLAHEQREVIRRLTEVVRGMIPCMEAAFNAEGDAFGILHNTATDALSSAEVALAAAAPYVED